MLNLFLDLKKKDNGKRSKKRGEERRGERRKGEERREGGRRGEGTEEREREKIGGDFKTKMFILKKKNPHIQNILQTNIEVLK